MTTPFDDLELLRVFVRIVESGSISAAARSAKIPQPTLSRHLRTLEERARVTLLLRDTHRMRLTDAGGRFLEDARSILAAAEDGEQRLHEGVVRGHLRIFATIDSGQSVVSRVIARFLAAHPETTIELGYTNRPVQMIEEGWHVGVVVGALADERAVSRPVARLPRFLVAAPRIARQRRATAPKDLKTWPWVALSGRQFGLATRSVSLASARAKTTIAISPVFVSEGVTSMRAAILEGLGVGVLPAWLVGEDLARRRLVRVLPAWSAPDLSLQVIHLAERALPARVRRFIEFAVQEVPFELGRGR